MPHGPPAWRSICSSAAFTSLAFRILSCPWGKRGYELRFQLPTPRINWIRPRRCSGSRSRTSSELREEPCQHTIWLAKRRPFASSQIGGHVRFLGQYALCPFACFSGSLLSGEEAGVVI